MKTLLQNGTVVTASDAFLADVWIDGEQIVGLVAPGTPGPAFDQVLDVSGKLVLPGGVDVHTHLDMPAGAFVSADDFESGTRAAAFGGTTTIVDFANQERGHALREALDQWHQRADGKACIDYGFHMCVTDLPPAVVEELGAVVKEGVTSFKLFMAYKNRLMLEDDAIFRAMVRAGELGALVTMHAEDGLPIDVLVERARARGHTAPIYHALTRPEVAEATATERTLALAEMAGVPVYVVHVTCQRAVERIREARDRGQDAFGETCPQYLFLSQEDLARPGLEGTGYVCSPPLRPERNQEHLWRALRNHDLHVVATDHCPFLLKGQKETGLGDFSRIPNGLPSIETRMMLLWEGVRSGLLSMQRFVEVTATAPARLFGLWPRKGVVAVGADADLVVWDPRKETTLSQQDLHMRVDYSIYEGRRVLGAPVTVLQRGKLLVQDGQFLGKPGDGRFLRRSTFRA